MVEQFFFFWLCHTACGILVLRPGIEPAPSAVKARSPNHWTARKFPKNFCSQSNLSDINISPVALFSILLLSTFTNNFVPGASLVLIIELGFMLKRTLIELLFMKWEMYLTLS